MNVWVFFSVATVLRYVSAPYSRTGLIVVLKIVILVLMVRLCEAQMSFILRKATPARRVLSFTSARGTTASGEIDPNPCIAVDPCWLVGCLTSQKHTSVSGEGLLRPLYVQPH